MTIRPEALFVTNRDDLATDYVVGRMREKGIPYLRVNSEDITEFGILSHATASVVITVQHTEYDLCDVRGVFFRRAPTIFTPSSVSDDTPYINRERREFLEGLYLGIRAKWINPLFSTYSSERKLYQLVVAREVGLSVPETCACNDPHLITSFINKVGACVIKPVSHGMQVTRAGSYSIYTSEITDVRMFDTEHLLECPVLIQEKVPNYRDIRVTVVGERLFPVAISKTDSQDVDWRKPHVSKSYEHHVIDEHLRARILALHRRLGLVYSAMDFILTPDGEYVFLEINPAGEWLWLERELQIDVSNALLDELLMR